MASAVMYSKLRPKPARRVNSGRSSSRAACRRPAASADLRPRRAPPSLDRAPAYSSVCARSCPSGKWRFFFVFLLFSAAELVTRGTRERRINKQQVQKELVCARNQDVLSPAVYATPPTRIPSTSRRAPQHGRFPHPLCTGCPAAMRPMLRRRACTDRSSALVPDKHQKVMFSAVFLVFII